MVVAMMCRVPGTVNVIDINNHGGLSCHVVIASDAAMPPARSAMDMRYFE